MQAQYGSFCCSIFKDRETDLWKRKSPENGGVAQLGEHLPCKQGVMGSNPIISTTRKGKGNEPKHTEETVCSSGG